MRIFLYIFFLLIIVLGVTFAYLNASVVVLNYYFGEHSMPLSLLVVCSLAVGAILGFFVTIISWLRVKAENHRLKKHLKCIQLEVENLRAMPIKDKT
jgi:lipopolysaccharide assembly protein A